MAPRHKQDSAVFRELDFQGQTRSLSATASYLRRALRVHAQTATVNGKNAGDVIENRLQIFERMIADMRTELT